MGSTLSAQEKLFLCRQWPELLQHAMQNDVQSEIANIENDQHANSVTCSSKSSELAKVSVNEIHARDTLHKKVERKQNTLIFTLSFTEWQAFLSMMEGNLQATHVVTKENEAEHNVAACLCDELVEHNNVHCPLINIAVFVYTWWQMYMFATVKQHKDADEVLQTRLERLVSSVNNENFNQEWKDSNVNDVSYASQMLKESRENLKEEKEKEAMEEKEYQEQEEELESLSSSPSSEVESESDNLTVEKESSKSKLKRVVKDRLDRVSRVAKPSLSLLTRWADKKRCRTINCSSSMILKSCVPECDKVITLLELTLAINARLERLQCELSTHLEESHLTVQDQEKEDYEEEEELEKEYEHQKCENNNEESCGQVETSNCHHYYDNMFDKLPLHLLEQRHDKLFKAISVDNSHDCPVMQVARHLILALIAACYTRPIYAQKGINALSAINEIMNTYAVSVCNAEHQTSVLHGNALPPISTEWKTLVELEQFLTRRQLELDVHECKDNKDLLLLSFKRRKDNETVTTTTTTTTIGVMREVEKIQNVRTSVNDETFASLAPAERWIYCQSQYIGQDHIWRTLQSHFLNADVFEVDKPTVIVFFGPSGFGKSEMAKRIASAIHGVPVSLLEPSGKLVYIHMPSFCTKEGIYSLVDPPAAHVGDGILLSALHANHDAVVVLDEFEKSTTEAVQHLWLSAFQKNGTLRSLKNAERTISTVRVTFILTCNIAAETITRHSAHYLNCQNATEQSTMRELFVTVAREKCKVMLGEPFVNRVDFFCPFVPYTNTQRRQFVLVTLERLITLQKEKKRTILVTPRFVNGLVSRVHTFHASTIEEIVKPLVVTMAEHSCSYAVFTLVQCVQDYSALTRDEREKFIVVPIFPLNKQREGTNCEDINNNTTTISNSNVNNSKMEMEAENEENATQNIIDGHWCRTPWVKLPGGETCWEAWQQHEEQEEPSPSPSTSPSASASIAVSPSANEYSKWNDKHMNTHVNREDSFANHNIHNAEKETTLTNSIESRNIKNSTIDNVQRTCTPCENCASSAVIQYETKLETDMCTEREVALHAELASAKEMLLAKDKEIAYLTEKVMLLEKALALALCAMLCCSFVLSVIIGVKLTVVLFGGTLLVMNVLMKIPLRVLLDAVRALYSFLGPVKFGFVMLLMALWLTNAL